MNKIWKCAHNREIILGPQSVLMGILNVTPDSFSDGGRFNQPDIAVQKAKAMIAAGAIIIDIGAETTKPSAEPIDVETELSRLIPVVKALVKETNCVISIDTYHAQTAFECVALGAHIINDVWGLQKDADMADIVAKTGAGVVIMHTGRERSRDSDVIKDQIHFLIESLKLAKNAGIADEAIVLDPGFGFAKTVDENMTLMKRANELHVLGYPLLAGTSRKRFIGSIANIDIADQRDVATAATSVLMRNLGFDVFRVHNIEVNRDALLVADAFVRANA